MPIQGFPNVPYIKPGGWYILPADGAVGTMTPALNRAYAIPFWPGRPCTLTGVSAEVTLLGVGNLRAALYRDSGSFTPGALVSDFGTISTGLAGVKTWSVSQEVTPYLHWLVIVQQGLVNIGLRSRATWAPFVYQNSAVLNVNATSLTANGVNAAFPVTFPVVAGAEQGPSVIVQLT